MVEAESKGAEFGLDGVKSVMKLGVLSASQLSHSVLEHVQDFMHTVPKHNDVTALSLTRRNKQASAPLVLVSKPLPA